MTYLSCVLGKQDSINFISCLRTLRQAMVMMCLLPFCLFSRVVADMNHPRYGLA